MLLMIDNYDSFTYNIVQYFAELGQTVKVFRNDAISIEKIKSLKPSAIIISPGPCTPNEAGISMNIITQLGGIIPILGVCLGHQSIGQVFGGKIIRAKKVMHGKISPVHHKEQGVFKGLNNPLNVTRYNSLVVDYKSLPKCLEVTAWTCNADGSKNEIMGLRHKSMMIEGVQFHPESIMTEQGHDLFENFLNSI